MSHFSVLVPAKDRKELEAVLLPYHEYECTGIEKYLEFVPADMDELKADYEEYGNGRDFEVFIEEWSGDEKNENNIYGRWTNPNAKWDWWAIGGRWSGLLKLKPLETRTVNTSELGPCNGFSEGEISALLSLYQENREKFMSTVAKYKGKDVEILKYVQTLAQGEITLYPNGSEVGNGSPGVFSAANSDPARADYAPAGWVDWGGILQGQLDRKMATYHRYHSALEKAEQAIKHRHEPYEGVAFDSNETGIIAQNRAEWSPVLEERAKQAEEIYRKGNSRGEHCRAAFKTESDYVLYDVATYIHDRDNKEHWLWDTFNQGAERHYSTEEEYHEKFGSDPLTYAFIDLDGNWNAKGHMGWFGVSSNENDNFGTAFWRFVQSLPDNQRVYVIDCHI